MHPASTDEYEALGLGTSPEEQEQRIVQREQLLSDVRSVLSTPAGKRLICDLLVATNWRRGCFTGNSKTYFLEGQQDMGNRLMLLIEEADPALAVEIYGQLIGAKIEQRSKK